MSLAGRWSSQWLIWDEFARFVGQMARWSMRRTGNETLRASFEVDGRRGHVTVDVLDRDERFINGLALAGTVQRADRTTGPVSLEQVAPGRYQGSFTMSGPGRYYLSLGGSRDELRVGPRPFGLAVPYSPEYRDVGPDMALLGDLARLHETMRELGDR